MKCSHNSMTCNFDTEAAVVQDFSTAALLTFWVGQFLVVDCPVHCSVSQHSWPLPTRY